MFLSVFLTSAISIVVSAQVEMYPLKIEFPSDIAVSGNILQPGPSGTYTQMDPPLFTSSPGSGSTMTAIIMKDSPGSGQVVRINMSGEGVLEPTISCIAGSLPETSLDTTSTRTLGLTATALQHFTAHTLEGVYVTICNPTAVPRVTPMA